ncbi:MAG: YbjN domain-containing protein [Gloeomargarita sp. SKYBB_i_bin120]|nr:YbjN domain-containing protein [Gloeomargarita sp. SKYG98]MCS7292844.1 YbjN domain-containing protein [Gloeomargarita sp. SKYB120]MDW8178407.1 YbjN domain-containing protein [Gloeomargarita sp. SKYBB_i_bin120]
MDVTFPELTEAERSTQRMDDVETVISSLAEPDSAQVSHLEQGYIWRFRYGTVEVYVQMTGTTPDDMLTVWSTVLKLPVQQQADLFQQLLELNWATTMEARFALLNQEVVVVGTRSVQDLDPSEVARLITIVASLADLYDEELQTRFPAVNG